MKNVLSTILFSTILLLSRLAAGQAGSSPNQQLIDSVRFGDAVAVNKLLQTGVNIESKDQYGKTALWWAIDIDNIKILRLLLEKGANIEGKDNEGNTALIMAARHDQTDTIQFLLENGANIDAKNNYGHTALLAAIYSHNTNSAKLLIEKGTNIEAKNELGMTALLSAVYQGNTEIVKLLLEKGANIEAKDIHDMTALILAADTLLTADQGKTEIVKLLLDKGADVWAIDSWHKLALQEAESDAHPNQAIITMLQQAMAQHPKDEFARTMLDFRMANDNDEPQRREKVIRLVLNMSSPPPIPNEAKQDFQQATAILQSLRGNQSSSADDLEKPINLLGKALKLAPWWANAYYNLAIADELRGWYDDAITQLNYYLELQPSESDAANARAKIAAIESEKEIAKRKQEERESMLSVRYVGGGVSRIHASSYSGNGDEPKWWFDSNVDDVYLYKTDEESPFYVNAFRFPNGHILVIILDAQSNNGAYAGDKIAVWDKTDDSCREGWSNVAFDSDHSFTACGFHYSISVTSPPNALVLVRDSSGASISIPLVNLYRGRALLAGTREGKRLAQPGSQWMWLQFDDRVVQAAKDPNVNAMGLTPTTVTPQSK